MTYTFHQSWLGTALKCLEQARVEMFEAPERITTDSQALGLAVHAAIEFHLDSVLHDESPHDLSYDVIENMLDALEPWKYTKYSKLKVRELAAQAFDSWREHIEPAVRVEAVEVEFDVPFGVPSGRDVRLAGRMDAVDARGPVIDWKTGSREYERWEYQRWAVQPTVYTYADSILRPAISTGEFTYHIMLHDGRTQEMTVTRDARHWEWLGVQIDRIIDLIEADLPHWPLNDAGWHCSPVWCSNFTSCKGLVMGPGNDYKN